MSNMDRLFLTWEQTGSIFDQFGVEISEEVTNHKNLNLSLCIIRKKATLNEIASGLIGVMGLHIASSNEGGWERLVIATFILIILSPFDLKLIKDVEIEKLLELIESEYGDKFIRADNLKLISERSNSVDTAVQWMIRNDFLQEEKNGKYFFKNHILKSFKIDFF